MVWSNMELPLQHRPSANLFQNHIPETADDSPFYSSPAETCPSPLSDATFSLPPTSGSSISSGSVSVVDQYPKDILKDMTASPLQMASPLRWEGAETTLPPSHLVPLSLEENLIQPVCVTFPPLSPLKSGSSSSETNSKSLTRSYLSLFNVTTPLHRGLARTAFHTKTPSHSPTFNQWAGSSGQCEAPAVGL